MARRKFTAFDLCNYLLMLVLMFMCIYPFYYILIYSLSDPQEALKGILFLPVDITFVNYTHVFRLDNMLNSFFVSVARTVIGTLITIFASTLLAYLVTKNELYLRKYIYRFVVITMYFQAGLIPWYITMKFWGLQNNFLVYVLPEAITAFYVVLIKTFVEQLPKSLEESAMIDGAGFFKVFVYLIFPLSMPIVATIAVFSAVGQWNNWFDNYFLVSSDHLQTMQLILYNYLSEAQNIVQSSSIDDLSRGAAAKLSPESIRVTVTMVVTVPVLFVYPFLQRYFVKGIMLGAIKG